MKRLALATVFCLIAASPALAQRSFDTFLRDFEATAVAAGITADVYRAATRGLTEDSSVPERVEAQPEFETAVWDYLDRRITDQRIANGQRAYEANRDLFARVGREFGVDPYVLAAIWGIESDFGAVLDNPVYVKPVIRSLASLVFHERGRVEADARELIAALRIIQMGDATAQTLLGSWAGAIGHLQLIPTAFLEHAVDYDGDGRRDPHRSLADALASSAQYLRDLGYTPGQDWGYEVSVPEGFDYALAGREQLRPLSFFADRGIRRVRDRAFRDLGEQVFLYLPAGRNGPKFLMTSNYLVFKGYNFSDSYALTVGHLADRLRGSPEFAASWPRNARFLNREERIELQTLLVRAGYLRGPVEGRLGPITSAALRDWQAANGLVADGFATIEALEALRRAAR